MGGGAVHCILLKGEQRLPSCRMEHVTVSYFTAMVFASLPLTVVPLSPYI